MYNNDYFIGVDENGQPYIAHAYATDNKGSNYRQGVRSGFKAGVGSGMRAVWGSLSGRATKYIDKVKTKSGKWRYIYPETVKKAKSTAKKAWGSKAGRWIDEHDAGLSEKLMSKAYGAKKRRAQKSGDHDAASYYSKRQQALKYEGRREGKAAKEAIRSRGQKAKDRVKDWAGYDERERLNNAKNASAKSFGGARNKQNEVNELQRDYDKTILGLIDNIRNRKKKAK